MSRPILLTFLTLFAMTTTIFPPSVASTPIDLDKPGPKPIELEPEKRTTHTGRGTWFYPGLGNCGQENTVNDPIIAIPETLYDQNGGSNCGQWIHITDVSTGKVAYGRTADSCPGCGSGDLDMSPEVFQQFTDLSVGEISISWYFLPQGESPPS